jgi:NAD(P)-dependent dehydrogenase (short-subunit alcohol dehydrogenase family)
MTDLTGTTILVVGASGGLGSRISDQLEAEGATVVRASRSAAGDAGGVLLDDVRDESAAAALLARVAEQHDRIDGLVIAPGAVAFGPVADLADDTLRDLFEVNALAPIRLIREAIPALTASSKAGGSPFVLTLSGIVSEMPTAGLAAYSAAKSALAAFTVASTRELRKAGIRIVDARPGHIDTGLADHPIAGTAPSFPTSLDPDRVAARIVRAIIDDERDLPSSAFEA